MAKPRDDISGWNFYFMPMLQRSSYIILPGRPVKVSCQTFGSLKFLDFNIKLWQNTKKKKKNEYALFKFCKAKLNSSPMGLEYMIKA